MAETRPLLAATTLAAAPQRDLVVDVPVRGSDGHDRQQQQDVTHGPSSNAKASISGTQPERLVDKIVRFLGSRREITEGRRLTRRRFPLPPQRAAPPTPRARLRPY